MERALISVNDELNNINEPHWHRMKHEYYEKARQDKAKDHSGRQPEALLAELETLEPDWVALVRRAETAAPEPAEEALLERVSVYFLFRYLLKAVNDGDVLGRVQFCVLAVLTVERLAAVCGLSEALRRFSCEIEHSQENLERLLAAFWQSETFSPERFQNELFSV